ncbi:MAG: NAD-dependent epimerase/dehydratase family protein [Candidatus Cloacimonadota bacterium]|nr:NAD-dependent epimerase/dehydratase family protein [Candidatus Cloacimonadota bacterium]
MKILVTGGAGFIGSHLCEGLIELNHSVVTIDSLNNYYSADLKSQNLKDIKQKGVEFHKMNLIDGDYENIVKSVDIIFHLAAQPGINKTTPFEDYLNNNIIATKSLLDKAIRNSHLKLFVNVATSSVYGKFATRAEDAEPMPTSYYGVTKLAAEQLVMSYQRENKIKACSLRLYSVYGPRERPEKLYPKLIDSILKDKEFPLFEGSREHSRSFTYIDDIIDGFIAVIENHQKCNGEIFNIGSDIKITTGEAIDFVEELMNKKGKFAIKPKRPGDQQSTYAIIDKAQKLLGYAPKTKPEDGFKKEIEWYKEKIYNKIELY